MFLILKIRLDTDLKIIMLNHLNNYIGLIAKMSKFFAALSSCLSILY